MTRDHDGTESSAKKKPLLKEIDDVVSIGALLRPTISKAVAELKTDQLDSLRDILIDAERALADSHLVFRERFVRAQAAFTKTFVFAPTWRFIAGRIEESWKNSEQLTVRELSLVSLLLGMLIEETQTHIGKRNGADKRSFSLVKKSA